MRRDAVTRELLALLVGAAARFSSEYDAAAEAHGLTGTQARLLAHIAAGPAPMNRLAALLRCEPSNVTGLVDRLEGRGLVARRPSPNDRRVRLIAATAEGARLSAEVWAGLDTAAEALSALSEHERLILRDALRGLAGLSPGQSSGQPPGPGRPGGPARTAPAPRSR